MANFVPRAQQQMACGAKQSLPCNTLKSQQNNLAEGPEATINKINCHLVSWKKGQSKQKLGLEASG